MAENPEGAALLGELQGDDSMADLSAADHLKHLHEHVKSAWTTPTWPRSTLTTFARG